MNLDIVQKRENPLLGRQEIVANLNFRGPTPSRMKIKEALASQLGVKGELVFVTRIATLYGAEKAKVQANVYKRIEDSKIEPRKSVKKNLGIKEKKEKQAEKKEAKAEDKVDKSQQSSSKAETKKEEAKPKEKKEEVKSAEAKPEEKKEEKIEEKKEEA